MQSRPSQDRERRTPGVGEPVPQLQDWLNATRGEAARFRRQVARPRPDRPSPMRRKLDGSGTGGANVGPLLADADLVHDDRRRGRRDVVAEEDVLKRPGGVSGNVEIALSDRRHRRVQTLGVEIRIEEQFDPIAGRPVVCQLGHEEMRFVLADGDPGVRVLMVGCRPAAGKRSHDIRMAVAVDADLESSRFRSRERPTGARTRCLRRSG